MPNDNYIPGKAAAVNDYVTTGQAGKRVGVTSQTIRTWIKAGLLTGYRVGPRNFKVDPAELDALVVELYGQGDRA